MYNVLNNVDTTSKITKKKAAEALTRNAMPPTTMPTPGTRPTRPTRPTPPTRPTRPTDCPECNQNNCQQPPPPPPTNCGCPCVGQKKHSTNKNTTANTSKIVVGLAKPLKSVGTNNSTKNSTSAGNAKAKKRDFMNEVLDNSLDNSPHHADKWQDFYDNRAKWNSFQSPQVNHDSNFHLDEPNYKVDLAFHDFDHHTMEHAHDIAQNHVEAYPGEIVSGENYLSKFVSPADYGSVDHHFGEGGGGALHSHSHIETDHENTKAVYDSLNGFMKPLSTNGYHGNNFQGEHSARDRTQTASGREYIGGSRRNEFAERDGSEREKGDRESETRDFERESNDDEQRYHGDREGSQRENEREERYHNDQDQDRFHDDNDQPREEYHGNEVERGEDHGRDEKERGFSVDKENLKDIRVDEKERNVDVEHQNHFVDKQRYNEEEPQNNNEEETHNNNEGEQHHNEQERQHGEEQESLSDRLNEGGGEPTSRQEVMISKFAGEGGVRARNEDTESRESDFQQPQKNEEVNSMKESEQQQQELQPQIVEEGGNSVEQTPQEEGEENQLQKSYNEIEGGSRRSPDLAPVPEEGGGPDQEISSKVKGMINAIETSENLGSIEEKKFIKHLMDVTNQENEVLSHDLNAREGSHKSPNIVPANAGTVSSNLKIDKSIKVDTVKKLEGSAVLGKSISDVELSKMFAMLLSAKALTPSAPENAIGETKSITPKIAGDSRQKPTKGQGDNPKKQQQIGGNDLSSLKGQLEAFMKHLGDPSFKIPSKTDSKLTHQTITSIIRDVKQADKELILKSAKNS